jgi:hypothetical protein
LLEEKLKNINRISLTSAGYPESGLTGYKAGYPAKQSGTGIRLNTGYKKVGYPVLP